MSQSKKYFCFLLSFCSLFCSFEILGQNVGFSDYFNDGNITLNPSWQGDTAKFTVSDSTLQLSDSSETSPAILYTVSESINKAVWEFDVSMDFNPSGSNYAKIYIAADQSDPSLIKNGYFIKVGGQSGSVDDVSLYKINNGTESEIIDGADGKVGVEPSVSIKVTKDSAGVWKLFSDTSSSGNIYLLEGTATDTSVEESSFFIIKCIYTSTRSDRFYFDNFYVEGEKYMDTVPPKLLSAEAKSDSTLLISYSEDLDQTSLSTTNFDVDGNIGHPDSVDFLSSDSSSLMLSFSNKFSNGKKYIFTSNNTIDRNSNVSSIQSLDFIYFVPDTADFRDVVINEIYADENPSNGLPEAEFIELFNASNKIFQLKNWKLVDESSSTILKEETFRPGEYLILSTTDAETEFEIFGKVQAGDFPTLTNTGENIQLKNASGEIIDKIEYTDSWYGNDDKDDGGYSLEQINPFAKCNGISNFSASHDSLGGTPGSQNSIFDDSPDIEPPILEKVVIGAEDSLNLYFSEAIDTSSIEVNDFSVENTTIDNYRLAPDLNNISLHLSQPIDSGKKVSLKVQNISDCPGNIIRTTDTLIVLPFMANPQDLVINEILFNPRPEGFDFVEVYNRSDKIIGIDKLEAANLDNGEIANFQAIATDRKYLHPGEYYVFTEDRNNILSEYPRAETKSVFEVERLPPFNNDAGSMYLLDSKNRIIDSFRYFEDMHFRLLNDLDGVSLERVNPNIGTDVSGNFQSASETEGFATPGYINSQYFISIKNEGEVSVDPELFSPDNDGYHDILNIHYDFGAPNYVANVSIFNKEGKKIKTLANNELLGSKGSFVWDGLTDENEKAKIGIYIIYFEAFNVDGSKMAFKENCVVAGFLD